MGPTSRTGIEVNLNLERKANDETNREKNPSWAMKLALASGR